MNEEVKSDIKWRLKDLPSAEGVAELVKTKVLTTQEAREIILKHSGTEDRLSVLEEQVELLRGVLEILATNNRGAVTEINYPARYQTAVNTLKPGQYYTWTSSNNNSIGIN